jgi:hypothetical protein
LHKCIIVLFTDPANAVRRIRISAHFVGTSPGQCEARVDANTLVVEHIWPVAGTATAYSLRGWGKFSIFQFLFSKVF